MPKKDAPQGPGAPPAEKPSRLISIDLPLDFSEKVRKAAADSQGQVKVGDIREALRAELLKLDPRLLAAGIISARSAAALEALKRPATGAPQEVEPA